MHSPIVLIGGPTASGKSGVALALAELLREKGQFSAIINADALQLYRDLSVVTARPDASDEARAPHRLYGVLDGETRGSVAQWLELAREEIEATLQMDGVPIVVGGTGMYLHTLRNGLSAIPEIDAEVRAQSILKHANIGGRAFKAALAELDPVSAAKLHEGDTQRLIRAYEVVTSTGRTLPEWQAEPINPPPESWRFKTFVIEPTRTVLYTNCDRRFDIMLEKGALVEVKKLYERELDPQLPVMKAVGAPELMAVIKGDWTLPYAREKAQQSTRNYAKRQLTWFRHQLPEAVRLEHNRPEFPSEAANLAHQIRQIAMRVD